MIPAKWAGILLLLLTMVVPAVASPAGSSGKAKGRLHLTFDHEVPEELLRLVRGRVIDDDSLDGWVRLPGNREILRIGALRGDLTAEGLRENLWHTILGHPFRRGKGLGALVFDPLEDLDGILAELREREPAILREVRTRVLPYLPPEVKELHASIRYHLGGAWSGRTSDAIYVNLSFLHGFEPPWLEDLASIIAHEVIHMAHLQVSPLPADGGSVEALFGAALSQIQAEGIARHVEHQFLTGEYQPGTYGHFSRTVHNEGLAGFRSAFPRVDEIRGACMNRKDMESCRALMRRGLDRGGSSYAIGHGMARAIERALGQGTLASTLAGGPVSFFNLYLQASRMLPGFPVPGVGFEADLEAAGRALDARRVIWAQERKARVAHSKGRYGEAARILKQVMDDSPGNTVAAYNLACALARDGRKETALEWLERAIDLGYRDLGQLNADPDLESLRKEEVYLFLLERLSPPPSSSSDAPKSSMK